MGLKRGIDKAVEAVAAEIRKRSKPIKERQPRRGYQSFEMELYERIRRDAQLDGYLNAPER